MTSFRKMIVLAKSMMTKVHAWTQSTYINLQTHQLVGSVIKCPCWKENLDIFLNTSKTEMYPEETLVSRRKQVLFYKDRPDKNFTSANAHTSLIRLYINHKTQIYIITIGMNNCVLYCIILYIYTYIIIYLSLIFWNHAVLESNFNKRCFSSKSSNPNKCNWACQVGQHKHYQCHWPPSPNSSGTF